MAVPTSRHRPTPSADRAAQWFMPPSGRPTPIPPSLGCAVPIVRLSRAPSGPRWGWCRAPCPRSSMAAAVDQNHAQRLLAPRLACRTGSLVRRIDRTSIEGVRAQGPMPYRRRLRGANARAGCVLSPGRRRMVPRRRTRHAYRTVGACPRRALAQISGNLLQLLYTCADSQLAVALSRYPGRPTHVEQR